MSLLSVNGVDPYEDQHKAFIINEEITKPKGEKETYAKELEEFMILTIEKTESKKKQNKKKNQGKRKMG